MGRISIPGFQSVVQTGGLPTPQMQGDWAAPVRAAEQDMRQIQGIGQSFGQLGQVGMEIATDMQREANRVQVIGAQNDAQRWANDLSYGNGQGGDEPGYLAARGQDALGDHDGLDLSARYGDKLKRQLDEVQGRLGNEAQKKAFSVWRGNFEADFGARVQAHQRKEFTALQESTYKGAIEVGVNNAMADWASDERVRDAIDGTLVPGSTTERYGGVRQAAYALAKAQGKSALEAEYDVRRAVSGAHVGVITQALAEHDGGRALAYLRSNKADMLETDVLKVNGHVQTFVNTAQAQTAVAAQVKSSANQFQPTDMDRLLGVVQSLESGGRDFASDGTPLKSKAGAMFAMQVMPETARDPGYGVRPAQSDTPEEYNRVGRELLGALVKKYGNVGQALAAYNGGGRDVDKAIDDAEKAGNPGNWLEELRKYKSPAAYAENSAYVKNGIAKFGAGDGAPRMPTLQEFTDGAVARLGEGASPEAIKLTRQAAEHQFEVVQKSIKARDDAAVADAMRALQENGGRVDLLDAGLRSRVPPKELDNLYTYAGRIAKGDDRTSEWLYAKLAGDPKALAALSDDQFYALRKELSESDFKHFANERAKAQGKTTAQDGKAGDLNSSAIKNTLDTRLRTLGIDPTPKDDGGKDAARVGAIRQFVDQYFIGAQREAGKKFSDAEVSAHLDALFAQNATLKGWFSDSSKPMLTLKAGDIPSADKDNLKAAMKKAGVSDPTDAQLLGAYWNLRTLRAKPKPQRITPGFFDTANSIMEGQ